MIGFALNSQRNRKTLKGIAARARGRVKRAPGQAWQSHVVEPLDSQNRDRQRRERFAGSQAKQASADFYSRVIRKTLLGRGAIARVRRLELLGRRVLLMIARAGNPQNLARDRQERASGATG